MTTTTSTEPRDSGVAVWVTQIFESLGVLNKGSSKSAATPSADDAAQATGVNTNSLNVTRVGGLAATITAAGAAALAIFKVTSKTKVPIVVAAYASVGVIVAAALLTAAIIISADIRGRTAVQGAAQPKAKTAPSPAKPEAFSAAWQEVLKQLTGVHERMGHGTEPALDLWLDAAGTEGLTAHLSPAAGQETLHAQLTACRSRVVSKYRSRIDIDLTDTAGLGAAASDIQDLMDSMQRLLQPVIAGASGAQ